MSMISNGSYLHQFSLQRSVSTSELFLMQPQPWLTNSPNTTHISKESLTIIPKTPAFVFGERVVQPVVSVISACFVSFNDVVTRMFNFPPGASAAEVARKDSCEDPKTDQVQGIQTNYKPITEVLSQDKITQYAVVANSWFNQLPATVLKISDDKPLRDRIDTFFNIMADSNEKIKRKSAEVEDTAAETKENCLQLYSADLVLQQLRKKGIDKEFYDIKKIYVLNKQKNHYLLHVNGSPAHGNNEDEQTNLDSVCSIDVEKLKKESTETFMAFTVVSFNEISALGQATTEDAFLNSFRSESIIPHIEKGMNYGIMKAFERMEESLTRNKSKALDPNSAEKAIGKRSCDLKNQHETFVNTHRDKYTFRTIIVEGSKICYWEVYRNRGAVSRILDTITPGFAREKILPDSVIGTLEIEEQLVFRFRKGSIQLSKLEQQNTVY